jgi:hypothetical protein
MINLEEEARRRRERLLRSKTGANEAESISVTESAGAEAVQEAAECGREETDSVFVAPEGLTDASGAEILSLDNKYADAKNV